ncbi:hypothetical protein [Clostridium sp. UBA5988]|uniref:hypothetical protein n=1 Tax=Clostridium sp. UBA5988 TaxID=1946369 RepID=UPI00321691AE
MTYEVFAIIQLLVLIFILARYLKKQGIVILVDQVKIMFLLWIITLILYDFKLSTLYSPTIQINIISIVIWGSFLILSKFTFLKTRDINTLCQELKEKKNFNIYFHISNLIFIVAVIVFIYNVNKYGLKILEENKIDKQQIDHYATYIVHMLVLCAEIKYILFRNNKRIVDIIVFIGSLVVLALTLNRGPIAFLFITIGIYEVFRFIDIKDSLSKGKKWIIYGGFTGVILLFIWFFGYIGNMRMEYVLENIYDRTLWEHYGVSPLIPSGFLWLYIYLTSPLQNAAFAISNEVINGYGFFGNLFYPFVKFGANIIGKGEEFKLWLINQGNYTPHLQEEVGLNAMTFIPEAFQDAGLIGLVSYLSIYILLGYISIRIIKSKKMSAAGKILIYTNITSIILWSIFVNSFKIPILILNILLIFAIEYLLIKKESWVKPWMKRYI